VELRKHEGITLLEHFRKRTEVLSFQLDVHWHARMVRTTLRDGLEGLVDDVESVPKRSIEL
jgi:hypothetical protein